MSFIWKPCATAEAGFPAGRMAPSLWAVVLALLWSGAGLHAREGVRPAPAGFSATRAVERYGTAERKLQNGSIFDYMDGGGIVYLEHAFRELEHREYADPENRRINLDIFTLATAADAMAALADERIVPPGGADLSLGVPNKSFLFSPDYFVYLVVGNRFYYFQVNDSQLAETLNRFIRAELAADKEESK